MRDEQCCITNERRDFVRIAHEFLQPATNRRRITHPPFVELAVTAANSSYYIIILFANAHFLKHEQEAAIRVCGGNISSSL